jgi:hypothetical protein
VSDATVTPQAFSRVAWRAHHKQLFRLGCDLLDISYPTVARLCDEDVSTVKAWASPHRDHAVPDWAMHVLRRQAAPLAAFIDRGMEALALAEPARANDADAQTSVTAQKLCELLALLVAIMPDGVNGAEANGALASLMHTNEHINRLVQQYQKLAGAKPGLKAVGP